MAGRRDQAQAYRFLHRRQTASLLHGDPDGPDSSVRRLGTAMFSSLLVGALLLAGFGIFGLLAPGGATAWRNGKALIVEKGTGSRFIYAGGALHPVLNYTSARLLLGNGLTTSSVSASSLGTVPRGLPVGIPGAPEEIPGTGALLAAPWTACSVPANDAAGNVKPYVRLTLGPDGSAGTPLGQAQALLVEAPDGTLYLVWNDQRFRIGPSYVPAALGYAAARPLGVGAAWLDTVPQGPDLAAPAVSDKGRPGPTVGGKRAKIGQVFSVTNVGSGTQHYLALADGLAPVTETQAALLLYAPHAAPAQSLTAAEASQAPVSSRRVTSGLPPTPPGLIDSTGEAVAVCAAFTDTSGASTNVTITTRVLTPDQLARTPAGTSPASPDGGPLADTVTVPSGHAALTRALPTPGLTGGTLYLVTDLGVKYPLPDAAVLSSLGLAGVTPVPVPTGILSLLRTGPDLDPHDAAETVPVLPDHNGSPQPQIPVPAASH
ncbi:type VII secretion protein EccB [Streptomyces sp. NPDC051987]|uniref:type VII secretion protein EccB n=1 Tax=Streptomyces sp. NPDC051987 TaxID=3155808 RepID=UPI003428FB09